MKLLLKYIISLALLVIPMTVTAQDSLAVEQSKLTVTAQDSVAVKQSTLPVSAQDTLAVEQSKLTVDIYADYGKGIESLIQKQTKWEFGLGMVLKDKHNFVVEYGYGSLNPENVINNGTYTSEGNYFRAGYEYMFRIAQKRYLSTGLMYANASFSDNGSVQIESDLWSNLEETFYRGDLSASWGEIIINTQGAVSNAEKGPLTNLYWGVRFRLRILLTDISRTEFDIYAIPGYGKTYSTVVPAANFFLKYRIGF